MTEDLQAILEKINREGIEKANAAAAEILAEAKAKAAAIVKEAGEAAAKAKAEGEKAAADYAARAAETVAQAERDTVLRIEAAVGAMLERALVKNVDRALADGAVVKGLVADAVRELNAKGEIACGEKLAKALASETAALGNFTVVTDPTYGTGFSVRLDGGRVEHAFNAAAITEELAKRLRPDLAKLLKQ